MKNVLVINGPNLNMLGKRPKEHYGSLTLKEINKRMINHSKSKLKLSFYQNNEEGNIVTKIQKALKKFDAIIINPAAYTHTSVAIHDALEIFTGIKVEVHLSKVNEREEFRKTNFITSVTDSTFSGKMVDSYLDALDFIIEKFDI